MKNRVVLFDVDGVLADFILGWWTVAEKLGLVSTVTVHTLSNPTWDFPASPCEEAQKSLFGDVQQYIEHNTREFFMSLPCLCTKEEMSSLHQLEMNGWELVFGTNRPYYDARRITQRWLQKNFDMQNPTVIVTGKKGDLAQAIGATAMLDDKAGNCVYTIYQYPSCHVCLLDRPYNRFNRGILGHGVKRIYSVHEFCQILGQMELNGK